MTACPKERRRIDPAYMTRVRRLPCCVAVLATTLPWRGGLDPDYGAAPCFGPVEAHHAGRRIERKGHDDETIPLCHRHHGYWHSRMRPFDAVNRRAWAEEQIRIVRVLVEAMARLDADTLLPF